MTGIWRPLRTGCGFHDGGDLGYACTGYDAGGTDGAGADADFDGVCACVCQGFCAGGGADIAGDDLEVPEVFFEVFEGVDDADMMAVGAVEGYDVDADLLEGGGSFEKVFGNPECGADEETAKGSL